MRGDARRLKARRLKARRLKARCLKARRLKARRLKARRLKARCLKARRLKARQGKARQGKERQGKARQGKARQGKARQGASWRLKARQFSPVVLLNKSTNDGGKTRQSPTPIKRSPDRRIYRYHSCQHYSSITFQSRLQHNSTMSTQQ